MLRNFYIGALAVVAAASACTRATPAPEARPLRVMMGANPVNLDPHTSFDDVSSVVLVNVYEPLVRFDRNLRLVPALASRWINPDDRTWRFYLDPQARFSDGTPVRAADVKFSVDRLRSVSGSQLVGFVRHVSSVDVIDEHTVDLRTQTPVSILNGLALIPIVSERRTRELGGRLEKDPFGTGAYRVARWDQGQQIVLEPNPHHPRPPVVKRVEILLRGDGLKPDELLNGNVDLALYPGRRVLDEMDRRKPETFSVLSSESLAVYYVTLNTRAAIPGRAGRNPLADARVRRALALALDPAEIGRAPLRGLTPATQLTVPQVFGYDPSLQRTAPDRERARAQIAALFPDGLEVALDAIAGGTPTIEKRIVEQWQLAGVKASLRELKEAEATRVVRAGEFMATVEGYVCTSADASELLTYLLHTPSEVHGYGSGNSAGYSNPEVDRLAEQNLAVFDAKERQQLLQRALRLAAEDAPYLPLFAIRDHYILRRGIEWRPAVNGEVRLEELRFAEAAP
jgi:peptide/nickel transport system substrate-binding protein